MKMMSETFDRPSIVASTHNVKILQRDILRLTTLELSKLAKVSPRTVQEIELGNSLGTMQTMYKILGILGLRLGVVEAESNSEL